MTKKDYQLIAKVLHDYGSDKLLILRMADALKSANPNFRYDTFLAECEDRRSRPV